MTTIAAVQGSGWVVIGADSQSSEENRSYTLPDDLSKIAQVGPYLLSAAGELKAINVMAHVLRPPNPPAAAAGSTLDRFIAAKFIPALRDCLVDGGVGKADGHDSDVLLAVNGVAYEIGSSYEWLREASGLYAIGSGGDFACAVLHHLASHVPTQQRTLVDAESWVRQALGVAAALDAYSSGPFVVLQQKHRARVART
jgi:ATP-dependent protease HslVU (ClpYQ) peptidase subunit